MKLTHPSAKNGQSMVELALLLPLLILISVVTIDMGRGIYYYSALYNAAREGARYGIVNQQPDNLSPVDQQCILDAARHLAIGLDQEQITFSSGSPSINGNFLTVELEYPFQLVTPIAGIFTGQSDFTITLRSASTMLIER
jgi:hypothetical protein